MSAINPNGDVIYVVPAGRVSDKSQLDGASLEDQKRKNREFCEQHGFVPVAEFYEQASGYVGVRDTIGQAYAFCKNWNRRSTGKVRYIIFYDSSRFFRNTEEYWYWRKMFGDIGVRVNFSNKWLGDSEADLIVESLDAATAEIYSRRNSHNTNKGQYAWAERGKPCSRPPRGIIRYVNPENKNDFDFTVSKTGAIIVRAIHLIAGGQSPSETFRHLGGYKVLGSKSQFYDNVKNPMYALRYYLDGTSLGRESKFVEVFSTKPEQFVPWHIFQQAQANLAKGNRQRGSKHAHLFPAKGILQCSGCSHTFSTSTPKGRNGVYHHYSIRKGYCSGSCGRKSTNVQSSFVHPSLSRLIHSFALAEASQGRVKELIKAKSRALIQLTGNRLKALRADLAKATELQSEAVEMLIESRIRVRKGQPALITAEQKQHIDDKVNRLNAKINELETVLEQKQAIIARVLEFTASLGSLYDQADSFQKNAILKMIFPEGLEMEVESTNASPLVFRTARVNSIFSLIDSKPTRYAFLEIASDEKVSETCVLGAKPDTIRTVLIPDDVFLFRRTMSFLGLAV